MSYVDFIDDDKLYAELKAVLTIAQTATDAAEGALYSNVIDPFSAVLDSMRQGITLTEWLEQEKARQIQKTMQNALGNFHQKILGSVPGWKDLGVGSVVDIENEEQKIIAEVKNKFNTTKGNHKKEIYNDLLSLITSSREGYTGYYVEVIPKSKVPYDKPFTPSDNVASARKPSNEKIRVIDGSSFYALATGVPDALAKLYAALPHVIADILDQDPAALLADPSFQELFHRAYPFTSK